MSSPDRPLDVNPSQWEAITHEGSHLLIVAGPGTGKTHTLTHRIVYFCDRLKDSQRILAVTFTHKAAHQMRERLVVRAPQKKDAVDAGTFHSFCLKFLQEHLQRTDFPKGFQVADSLEVEKIAKRLWPAKSHSQRQEILEAISQWKAGCDHDRYPSDIPKEAADYNDLLRTSSLLDFDDLLGETYKLLKTEPEVLAHVQASYPFVFVDEYQDINGIQQALLKILVGEGVFLTAIGDPHQSIYSFRGSDLKYFESFPRDFPGAVIRYLQENYRSAPNLLKASTQIMASKSSVEVPELIAQIYTEGHLTVYGAATDKAEAEYVVHTIEKLLAGTSLFSHDSKRVDTGSSATYSFGDIAVFYRLKAQGNLLAEAFQRSGIPYHITGERPSWEEPLEDSPEKRSEKVSLMTIHASKGLEFPVVFIVGCEENLLPLRLPGRPSDLEEERRLFYVGMTRAKDRLYLTHCRRRRVFGQIQENPPSRFLADIEEELKAYEQSQYRLSLRKRIRSKQLTLFRDS